MQYEPIKKSLGGFFSGTVFMRKLLYFILDILLLRAWHIRKYLGRIKKELPDHAEILDAGSGLGQYTWRLARMNKTWKIYAVDIDREQIEECSEFFIKARLSDRVFFKTSDLTSFNDPGHYDFILSVDVMEHIKEDVQVFRKLHDSLKINGILLISTPSDQGGSDVHSKNDDSFIDEHVRNGYSRNEITGKLAGAGFHDTKVSYTYGKPGIVSWHLTMKYPVKMLNKSYLFFIILPFYYMVILPVSLILNIIDLNQSHKTGTGLIVTARK